MDNDDNRRDRELREHLAKAVILTVRRIAEDRQKETVRKITTEAYENFEQYREVVKSVIEVLREYRRRKE